MKMKKMFILSLAFILTIGVTMTAFAEDDSTNVISGDNYKMIIPEDFNTYEKLGNVTEMLLDALDTIKESPELIEQYLAENPDVAENLEKIQGSGDDSSLGEDFEEQRAVFEKYQFDSTMALNIDVTNREAKSILILTSDLSKVEEITAEYAAEEIEELNLIDASKKEQEAFIDHVQTKMTEYIETSFTTGTVGEAEVMYLPTDRNVEMAKFTISYTVLDRIEYYSTMYVTVVSGELFVCLYTDNKSAATAEEAASSIINTLTFDEVNREDILGMEPAQFIKFAVIAIIVVIIVIVILIVRLRKKKAKIAQQLSNDQMKFYNQNQDQMMNQHFDQTQNFAPSQDQTMNQQFDQPQNFAPTQDQQTKAEESSLSPQEAYEIMKQKPSGTYVETAQTDELVANEQMSEDKESEQNEDSSDNQK